MTKQELLDCKINNKTVFFVGITEAQVIDVFDETVEIMLLESKICLTPNINYIDISLKEVKE